MAHEPELPILWFRGVCTAGRQKRVDPRCRPCAYEATPIMGARVVRPIREPVLQRRHHREIRIVENATICNLTSGEPHEAVHFGSETSRWTKRPGAAPSSIGLWSGSSILRGHAFAFRAVHDGDYDL